MPGGDGGEEGWQWSESHPPSIEERAWSADWRSSHLVPLQSPKSITSSKVVISNLRWPIQGQVLSLSPVLRIGYLHPLGNSGRTWTLGPRAQRRERPSGWRRQWRCKWVPGWQRWQRSPSPPRSRWTPAPAGAAPPGSGGWGRSSGLRRSPTPASPPTPLPLAASAAPPFGGCPYWPRPGCSCPLEPSPHWPPTCVCPLWSRRGPGHRWPGQNAGGCPVTSATCRRNEPAGSPRTAGAWGGKSGGLGRCALWGKQKGCRCQQTRYHLQKRSNHSPWHSR